VSADSIGRTASTVTLSLRPKTVNSFPKKISRVVLEHVYICSDVQNIPFTISLTCVTNGSIKPLSSVVLGSLGPGMASRRKVFPGRNQISGGRLTIVHQSVPDE